MVLLSGWTALQDHALQFAEDAASIDKVDDPAALAARNMMIARYYIDKHDHIAAINRFKGVVTECPTCPEVEEALAGLTETYLTLGIDREAQIAAAVLVRKFPGGRWSLQASDALRAAGLEPAENEKSWISCALK
jgi:outer membrane protein assembly factor BamD